MSGWGDNKRPRQDGWGSRDQYPGRGGGRQHHPDDYGGGGSRGFGGDYYHEDGYDGGHQQQPQQQQQNYDYRSSDGYYAQERGGGAYGGGGGGGGGADWRGQQDGGGYENRVSGYGGGAERRGQESSWQRQDGRGSAGYGGRGGYGGGPGGRGQEGGYQQYESRTSGYAQQGGGAGGGARQHQGGYDDNRGGYNDNRNDGGYNDRRGRGGGGGYNYNQGGGGGGGYDNVSNQGGGGYGGGGGPGYAAGSSGSWGADRRQGSFQGGNRGGRGGGGGRWHDQQRGGGRVGGRGGGFGRGGGGRGKVPPELVSSVITNLIPATVSDNFSFFLYTLDCADGKGIPIESRGFRRHLFQTGISQHLKDMPEKEHKDLERTMFFTGTGFYSARPVPGIVTTDLPLELVKTEENETMRVMQVFHYLAPKELISGAEAASKDPSSISSGVSLDSFRCGGCSSTFTTDAALIQHCQDSGHTPVYKPDEQAAPAPTEVFVAYANLALSSAMQERLARWGRDFVDPASETPATDRNGNDLGVNMFRAYACNFGLTKGPNGNARLTLSCDLRAKIIRTKSVLDAIYGGGGKRKPGSYQLSDQDKGYIEREWIGQVIIYKTEKKCYTITGIDFNHSPETLPIPGKDLSHADYFINQKKVHLDYPNVPPMITVIGRRKQPIHLPAELVMGNELDPRVREMLPQIASFDPKVRNEAIQKIKDFLIPGAQKTKGRGGLLPSLGIVLENVALESSASVMPLPTLLAAGVEVPPKNAENWAPILNRASFNVDPREAVEMNVVLFYHSWIKQGALGVYDRIKRFVNNFGATYRISEQPYAYIETGDNEGHWGEVQSFFSSGNVPENVFVLDFVKPRASQDTAYPVVKQMLATNGFLSQFVNFKTYDHGNPRDARKSDITLQGVARQILHKAGIRLWWVNIPKEIPLPAVFVGVDVFHSPVVYDLQSKQRKRKASCAAIIIQVFRETTVGGDTKVELYTKSFRRDGGEEYDLRVPLRETISHAMRKLQVHPASLVMWRDGIGDCAFDGKALDEIRGIREGLAGLSLDGGDDEWKQVDESSRVPIAYLVCQKRIAMKFLVSYNNEIYGAPAGTLVQDIQGLQHETFYINGRAPPYSTPKPVRYIVVEKDTELNQVPLPELTWGQCHAYPNWTGPVKVPSVCQMAHKLAELSGGLPDCGEGINADEFANKVHFL